MFFFNKKSVNIITFHYIRKPDLIKYKYLNILSEKLFLKKLFYLNKNFQILTPAEVHDRILNNDNFLSNEIWLTFDDGYKEHLNFVLPIFNDLKISASFYPTVKSSLENKLLDVNKIQFILSLFRNRKLIFSEIKDIYNSLFVNIYGPFFKFESKVNLNQFNIKDDIITKKIKQLLSVILPNHCRYIILEKLFKKYVSSDESEFAEKLYLNLLDLKELKKNENEIGGHGYNHLKFEYLDSKEQLYEINESKNFLKKNNLINKFWTFCYPHGSYNCQSIELLKKNDCICALTINEGEYSHALKFEAPRIDIANLIF